MCKATFLECDKQGAIKAGPHKLMKVVLIEHRGLWWAQSSPYRRL